MPFLPNRIQGQPFGSQNPQNPQRVAILTPGPAQPLEQFSAATHGIPAEVARALNQLQANVAQSVAQVKADPTANKNLLEGVTLKNGNTDGSNANIVAHGLGQAYRGYRICSVRGGWITGHAAGTPNTQTPAAQFLRLWTQITAFGSDPVTCDVEVYC